MKIEEIAGLIQIRSYLLDINNNRNIITSENKSILRETVKKIDAAINKEVLNENFLIDSVKQPKIIPQTEPKKEKLAKTKTKIPKTFSKEEDEKLLNESIK